MLVCDISNTETLVSITTEGCATVPFHGRGLQSILVCTRCSLFLQRCQIPSVFTTQKHRCIVPSWTGDTESIHYCTINDRIIMTMTVSTENLQLNVCSKPIMRKGRGGVLRLVEVKVSMCKQRNYSHHTVNRDKTLSSVNKNPVLLPSPSFLYISLLKL
jgi:hypothetical protein